MNSKECSVLSDYFPADFVWQKHTVGTW